MKDLTGKKRRNE